MKLHDNGGVDRSMTIRIDHDHPCLPGHFPGHPLVPGVVLLEHVAQALRMRHGLRLARIVEAKFMAPLLPGCEARVELIGEPPRLRFEIRGNERVLARGRMEACP
jgi:3-hydroxymyristoyl/3-hydroxydecanoyl-(acyl carrier protein) dehydratase